MMLVTSMEVHAFDNKVLKITTEWSSCAISARRRPRQPTYSFLGSRSPLSYALFWTGLAMLLACSIVIERSAPTSNGPAHFVTGQASSTLNGGVSSIDARAVSLSGSCMSRPFNRYQGSLVLTHFCTDYTGVPSFYTQHYKDCIRYLRCHHRTIVNFASLILLRWSCLSLDATSRYTQKPISTTRCSPLWWLGACSHCAILPSTTTTHWSHGAHSFGCGSTIT